MGGAGATPIALAAAPGERALPPVRTLPPGLWHHHGLGPLLAVTLVRLALAVTLALIVPAGEPALVVVPPLAALLLADRAGCRDRTVNWSVPWVTTW